MSAKTNTKVLIKKLTKRQIQIITLTAQGKTYGDISVMLLISEETVKSHIRKVRRKLNATNKTHATALALMNKLITP